MWILAIIGVGLATALAHLGIQGFTADFETVMYVIVLHQFAVTHGLIAVIGFTINVIFPKTTAAKLEWPSGPFQIKYGFSQLGLGVMGVMAIWFQGNFWVGVLVTLYIYALSGMWTHTQELMRKRQETGKVDKIEVSNMILNVIYHAVLTWMTLQIPGVWSLS